MLVKAFVHLITQNKISFFFLFFLCFPLSPLCVWGEMKGAGVLSPIPQRRLLWEEEDLCQSEGRALEVCICIIAGRHSSPIMNKSSEIKPQCSQVLLRRAVTALLGQFKKSSLLLLLSIPQIL